MYLCCIWIVGFSSLDLFISIPPVSSTYLFTRRLIISYFSINSIYSDYDIAIANGTELSGCNTGRFNWCYNVRATDLYLYYGAYILFTGLCFPIITVTINILFSMVLGPVPISFQQGMLNFSGSLARISGPIAVSALYSAFGPQAAWSLEFIVLGTNLIAWIYLYKRMVPLKLPENGN